MAITAKQVITPEAHLNYVFVNKPQPDKKKPENEWKYSVQFVFPKGTSKAGFEAAIAALIEEKWGGKVPKGVKANPLRSNEEKEGLPEGGFFVTARSKEKPGVVSIYKDKETGKAALITDPKEIYSGMYGVAKLTAFYYEVDGNKGISFALGNIQKTKDGERIDGRTKAEDDFTANLSEAPVDPATVL